MNKYTIPKEAKKQRIGFAIHSRLPSLNDYIEAINRNRHVGNKLKRDTELIISGDISCALLNGDLTPVNYPFIIHFRWYERTKRRDPDNIASAKKFILDAMQKCNVISKDDQRFVKGFTDEIIYGNVDAVVVEIEPYTERTEK